MEFACGKWEFESGGRGIPGMTLEPWYRLKAAGTPARQWQSYWLLQWQDP